MMCGRNAFKDTRFKFSDKSSRNNIIFDWYLYNLNIGNF